MHKTLIIILILALGLVVYAAGLRAVPGNITSNSPMVNGPYNLNPAFELSGSRSSFATLLAFNETGQFNLSLTLANLAAPDTGYYNGKLYSFFPPGVAILGLPFYQLGEHFNLSLAFAFFSVSLLAILTLIFLYIICTEIFSLPAWAAFFAVILSGFGSHFFNFSVDFYSQVPSTFLMLLAFYSVWRYKKRSNLSWLWGCAVWACYGLSSFLNYPNLILMLPLLAYFFISSVQIHKNSDFISISIKKVFIVTALIAVLFGGLNMYFNYSNFGKWDRFSNTLATYDPTNTTTTLSVLSQENVSAIANSKQHVSTIFSEKQFVYGLNQILFAFNKSLFVHDPFYILSFIGIFLILRKRLTAETGTLLGLVAVNIFVYASFGDPWGGWSFGPRYLVPSVPIFALFFSYWLASPVGASILKKILALLLFFYGSMVALLGVVGRTIIVPDAQTTATNPFRTFLGTIDLVKQNLNGNLVYNMLLRGKISLLEFYFIFLGFLTLIAAFTLFILPTLEKPGAVTKINP